MTTTKIEASELNCTQTKIEQTQKNEDLVVSFTNTSSRYEQEVPELLVIGAGLMRTGTTSLKLALEYLLHKPCYHMSELVLNPHQRESRINEWLHLFEQVKDQNPHQPWRGRLQTYDWSKLYGKFNCAVDYPTCVFYKYFAHKYPQSKIILTVRDPDDWVNSCLATTLRPELYRPTTLCHRLILYVKNLHKLPDLHTLMFAKSLGNEFPRMTYDELKQVFIEWNRNVQNSIPKHRLLIFDAKQGWGPLCEFLNVPIPPSDLPYPHVNNREQMTKRLDNIYRPNFIIISFIYGLFIFMLIPIGCLLAWQNL